MSFIADPLNHLTLTDLKFVDIRVLLIPLIIESPAIKIMFLGQGRASRLYILFTDIKRFGKFVPLELSGALIFCSTLVLDDKWLREADTFVIIIGFIFLVRVRCSIVEKSWQSSFFQEN